MKKTIKKNKPLDIKDERIRRLEEVIEHQKSRILDLETERDEEEKRFTAWRDTANDKVQALAEQNGRFRQDLAYAVTNTLELTKQRDQLQRQFTGALMILEPYIRV